MRCPPRSTLFPYTTLFRSGIILNSAAVPCRDSRNNSVPVCQQYHERSEEHTSELQSRGHLVCRLLLEKINTNIRDTIERRQMWTHSIVGIKPIAATGIMTN